MKQAVEVDGLPALAAHLGVDTSLVTITRYSDESDERIGWANTHIVAIDGEPVGFCEVTP